jgi:shikimate dehydrogenase
MHPNINAQPLIPYQFLSNKHLLYDLVYNPLQTKFLNNGKAVGATTQNGLAMLEAQAEASYQIWKEKV